MSDAPVAVTGAAGYLGSRLLGTLGASGRGLVRKPVAYLPEGSQVEVDLLADGRDLRTALEGAGAVVHLAGQNEVVAAQEPDRALSETLLAARHLTAAAVEAGVTRIVYVSTIHVYGSRLADDAEVDETVAPAPTSTYAISRLACEHLVGQATSAGVDVVVLRLSNAVGAPADPAVERWSLVATDLCRQAVTTGRLQLHSSGLQYRDFVALADVCALVARCTRPEVPSGTYNLASGHPMTVRGLAELVQDRFQDRTGTRPPLEAPAPDGPAPRPHHIRTDRLAEAVGVATTPIDAAIDELVEFCLTNEARL